MFQNDSRVGFGGGGALQTSSVPASTAAASAAAGIVKGTWGMLAVRWPRRVGWGVQVLLL